MTILLLENDPGNCPGCRLYVDGWCYAKDPEDKETGCPLKEVGLMEDKVRPLSRERFTKIYIEGSLV